MRFAGGTWLVHHAQLITESVARYLRSDEEVTVVHTSARIIILDSSKVFKIMRKVSSVPLPLTML